VVVVRRVIKEEREDKEEINRHKIRLVWLLLALPVEQCMHLNDNNGTIAHVKQDNKLMKVGVQAEVR